MYIHETSHLFYRRSTRHASQPTLQMIPGDLDRDFAVHARICLLGVSNSLGKGQGATLDAITKPPFAPGVEALRTQLMANGPRLTKDFFKEILLLLVDRAYLRSALPKKVHLLKSFGETFLA